MIDQHRFLIQFSEMVQINVRSTTSRRIRRVVQSAPVKTLATQDDVRRKYFVDHEVELATFARSTLKTSITCICLDLKLTCLSAILKIIDLASPDQLRQLLLNISVSSYLAGMLSCTDNNVVVAAVDVCRGFFSGSSLMALDDLDIDQQTA